LTFNQIRSYLDPASLLKLEAEESNQKITAALKTIDRCIEAYRATKLAINSEAAADEKVAAWEFDDDLCFNRLFEFRKRVVLVDGFIKTSLDFLKLEKVEVGVERWNVQIKAMYESFVAKRDEIGKQSEEKYDVLDVNNPGFAAAYSQFGELVLDFDRRLATIASLAFAHAGNLEANSKLVLSFQGLLERPAIAEEFAPNYSTILKLFESELDAVKAIFDEQKNNMFLAKNMPVTSGTLLVSDLFPVDSSF
jgi:dynein heavy chain